LAKVYDKRGRRIEGEHRLPLNCGGTGLLKQVKGIKLKIMCDNMVRVGSRGVLGEHGFAAMIAHGEDMTLLDTGQSATVILNNMAMKKGNMDNGTVNRKEDANGSSRLTVALSHGHFDHSGGLLGLASCGRYRCTVHAHPDAFCRRYKKSKEKVVDISMPYPKEKLLEVAEVAESRGQTLLKEWAMLSGEVARSNAFEVPETEFFIDRGDGIEKDPFLDDQSVFMNLEGKGLVIITGCAHSGIINIIDHARRATGVQDVYAVIGGFHMVDYSAGKMKRTIEALRERRPAILMPCHCTGIEAMFALREGLGKCVQPGSAGMEIAL
jgi:7,8-dihydropterin-6-yl-methyl-4-(beta-D-ribofuranosyl)aminobenzene 5'-phosphate synthase